MNRSLKNIPNPLLNDLLNEAINFTEIQEEHISEAVTVKISEVRGLLEQIYQVESVRRNFNNTIVVFDRIQNALQQVASMIYLLAYVHPDGQIRKSCHLAVDTLNQFSNQINLDEQLYQSFKEYSESKEAEQLSGAAKKYLDDRMDFYRRNGFALSGDERKNIKELLDKIAKLSLEFSTNVNEYEDALIVTEEQVKGLPDDYKEARRQDDGTYKITLDTPSYVPFMRYSESETARKQLMVKYLNRAPQNEPVLKSILSKRRQMAGLLGYTNYAEWQIEENMAHSTSVVFNFENDLRDKVRIKAQKDLDELLEVKYKQQPDVALINYWESSFYTNQLMNTRYGIDHEELKQYFSVDHVLDGLFEIASKLYGVDFEKVPEAPVWDPSVNMYRMLVDGKHAGYVYFDLFPRTGKYTHAACFTIQSGHQADQGYQYTSSALVCNFPPPAADKPSLLLHHDVVTLFHEFGHLMHAMLAHADLAGQSGISNVRDFVEVPSQMFENWAWNYTALQLFARHYQTGEILPRRLFDRMIAARNVGSGIQTQQQIFYGMLDMTYHTFFDPDKHDLTGIFRQLQEDITLFKYVEGTHMYNSFDHLTGYAAGYYGYLWAKVYAEDIFAEFEKNGVFDEATGRRFRDCILIKGATENELEMVKEFLQREPDQKAFLKSLGV
ncbi:MAG: Zn-dependent oligopeptidase [Bacteroidales bacterium]|jgi:thimet oligopeptidase|nr:Zn-dependent oligopeptidase [Bacteroidales bacterium]